MLLEASQGGWTDARETGLSTSKWLWAMLSGRLAESLGQGPVCPRGPAERTELFPENWPGAWGRPWAWPGGRGRELTQGASLGLPAACRTRWMPIPVAQTTRPAPWPAVSPWKPRQFWSGQGFSSQLWQ